MKRYWLALAIMLAAVPASAAYRLMVPGQRVVILKSPLTVTPSIHWNRISTKPGKSAEVWTLDGAALNDVTFYAGIVDDRPIVRDSDKTDRPLPRFSATMLAPDIAQLFEATYRIALGTPLIKIETVEPATFAGSAGFRFTFTYAMQGEEVRRKGEVNGAIIGGNLYMISFEAPAIHYFGRDLAAYRALVASARMGASPVPKARKAP